ncbi:MAG: DUF927 domain-containing protein [Algiphilus sp.]|uniref:DUF927 domain-containing protein n=1 Tax=Algiphilus sp. TaxID=1872431 RepID=UPI0032EBA7CD
MSGGPSLPEVVAQFADALRSAGIECSEPIAADGTLHRFHVEGDKSGSRNGWYVLYPDGIPAGEFGCWKRNISETWRADIGRNLSPKEEAEHRDRVRAMREARQVAEAERHQKAREKAAELWKTARPRVDTEHAYLKAKQVRAYGLRQLRGALLVPLRDARKHIHGLQFIQPDGSKRFGSGTAISGHYHAIAGSEGAAATDNIIAVAEGYATGATVREATGWPVAVAFNAGNLEPVARALRSRDPGARIVLCADNDHGTQGNPGVTKATAAAQAVNGLVALPDFAEDDTGTDWNDWACVHGMAATAKALRACVSGAPASASGEDDCGDPADEHPSGGTEDADATRVPGPRFEVHHDGVYWHDVRNQDGKLRELPPLFICSPLHIRAVTRDTHGRSWGRLVEFTDLDGVQKQWAMPARLLGGGRGDELRGELLDAGLPVIAVEQAAQRKLIEYLMRDAPAERARCVTRTGWHADAYVTPTGTFGRSAGECYYFQSESIQDSVFEQAGELERWRNEVGFYCGQHKRLIFALSCSFAGPLLHLAGIESGGFHLVGGSSSGKTTALRMAASVWGSPDNYWRQWRATDNGLEAIAEEHNDCLLALDEIGQADSKSVGEVAYMLANGRGKARANTGGGARRVKQWRVMLLSTGETGTAAMLNEAGKTPRAGHEVRLVEIGADAGASHGLFDSAGLHTNAAQLSEALIDGARRHYGHAGPAFVAKLAEDRMRWGAVVKERIRDFADYVLPANADGQARRVAHRFGLVCAAGELASDWRITGWDPQSVMDAISDAFSDWLNRRGGATAQEPRAMVAAVRGFLEAHSGARFQDLDNDPDDETERRIINRAGFRTHRYRSSTSVTELSRRAYFILPEVFRKEVCAGYDYREVARVLRDRGFLLTQESGKDRFTIRHRLPISASPMAVYAIDADTLFGRED